MWNVHNFGMTFGEARRLRRALHGDVREARAAPQEVQVFIMGDVNLEADGQRSTSRAEHQWRDMMEMVDEVCSGEPTRWDAIAQRASSIDRCGCIVARSAWTRNRILFSPVGAAQVYSAAGLSDHAPMMLRGSPRAHLPPDQRPVPPEIAQAPELREHLSALLKAARLEDIFGERPMERLEVHKRLLKEAARLTRDDLLSDGAFAEHVRGHEAEREEIRRELRLKAMARAWWAGDAHLSRRLLGVWSEAAEYIELRGAGVDMVRPMEFEAALAEATRAGVERRAREAARDADIGTRSKRAAAKRIRAGARRVARMWRPRAARLRFSEVVYEHAERAQEQRAPSTDPGDMFREVQRHWAAVFNSPGSSQEEVDTLLREWGRPWRMHGVRMPSSQDVQGVIERAPRTAPGPDGLPYQLWAAEAAASARTLHSVMCALASGAPAPPGFNDAWLCMLPKGREAGDASGAASRKVKALRPLSLKNTDSKTIAAATARSMRATVASEAHPAQRGFVCGRQLTANIVEMDAYARLFRTTVPDEDRPVLAMLDLLAAFPSVCRRFLFCVLVFLGFPDGLVCIVRALYDSGDMLWQGPMAAVVCQATSGVAQGCPLSGVLFVCVMDPVLRRIHTVLWRPRLGMVRACADDLALAMRTARAARLLAPEFKRAEKVAGLTLKAEKCQAVPLSTTPRPDDEEQWRAALESGGTGWGRFRVVEHAMYLGVRLGGATLAEIWASPVSKWRDRVSEAVREAPPAVAMSIHYAARILPVLGYIATMYPPPADMARLDRDAVCRMLRLPGSSMPYRGIAELTAEWGFPRFADAELYCLTALAVSATQTEAKWRPLGALLGPGTESDRPLARWGARYDDRQVGIPIAVHLADALRPPRDARPAARAVADALVQLAAQATRRKVQDLALRAVAPRWVAKAVQSRLAKVLLGDGSEPEPPPDAAQLDCIRGHARRLSPQWAVTLMRGPLNWWCTSHRMHDGTRDMCLFGCAGQGDCLAHYLRCAPVRMTVGIFDESDPHTSVADFFGLGEAADVSDPPAAFRRLILATLGYHAVRAHRRQHGMPSALRAADTLRATVAAHIREVNRFWQLARTARSAGIARPAGA